jgi:hypothetical protein
MPAKWVLFPCFFFYLFFLSRGAHAEARIDGLGVALAGNQVNASLTLHGAFDRRLSDRLESGLPTAIVYRFELRRDRKRWWDRRLAGKTLEIMARYDAVTRSYSVHTKLDGELIETQTLRDRGGLEKAMTHLEAVPVFSVAGMPHGERLLVAARAELGSRTILLFIPDSITTDWEESRKFRPPADPATAPR